MTINVKEMTTYDISDDGRTVTLSLVDDAGRPASLRFQIADLGNLTMTLPSLIEAALRRRLGDASFRYAYSMGSWSIEQAADPSSLIVTLCTKDGFGVSFCVPHGCASELGRALSQAHAKPLPALAH